MLMTFIPPIALDLRSLVGSLFHSIFQRKVGEILTCLVRLQMTGGILFVHLGFLVVKNFNNDFLSFLEELMIVISSLYDFNHLLPEKGRMFSKKKLENLNKTEEIPMESCGIIIFHFPLIVRLYFKVCTCTAQHVDYHVDGFWCFSTERKKHFEI